MTFERSRDSIACGLRSKIERVTQVPPRAGTSMKIKIIYSQVAEWQCVAMVNDYGSNLKAIENQTKLRIMHNEIQ